MPSTKGSDAFLTNERQLMATHGMGWLDLTTKGRQNLLSLEATYGISYTVASDLAEQTKAGWLNWTVLHDLQYKTSSGNKMHAFSPVTPDHAEDIHYVVSDDIITATLNAGQYAGQAMVVTLPTGAEVTVGAGESLALTYTLDAGAQSATFAVGDHTWVHQSKLLNGYFIRLADANGWKSMQDGMTTQIANLLVKTK